MAKITGTSGAMVLDALFVFGKSTVAKLM